MMTLLRVFGVVGSVRFPVLIMGFIMLLTSFIGFIGFPVFLGVFLSVLSVQGFGALYLKGWLCWGGP